ncbi:GMC family oxidoreductase [Lichenihabitans sp. Uapishka_5]|uniref:GMC family oxidoreductase n=1 Tax=Lichenihabitans sp. Uapishka_5 TaxID=3037302 RepID=UPI0029E81847|nr:GMC family oxidoreductase [Lichenihabitans sp. Uapishka_5]MDX7950988.1 GMC family oxidoreductase [Lichenihabitans sp. Uapishka_5]
MKLDAQRRYGHDEVVDAVVVGTGAGGAPLLARLARAGLKVVALEAGPNWEPHQHPADEVAASEIYWTGERLSGGPMPEAFGGNNSGVGVGGSTLHWGAFTPRPDARDLRLKTELGVGADWPVAHEELIRYIVDVERFIGVSGPADYPWDPGRRYPLPAVPRNASAEIMAEACSRLGIRTADAPAALVSRDFEQEGGPLRQACVNCGHCHQGCRNGAKVSMDVTYLPVAVSHGAEIRPEAIVHTIERDKAGRITAVVYRQGDTDHRQRCAALILSAGAVETPRLMLHAGLGNSSGQVGRNYMAHVATQVWGTFEAETRPNKGYPSSLITEDMLRPQDADFQAGYLVQSLGILPVTWAAQVTRGRGLWGQSLFDYLHRYNHVAGIGINGECLPHDDNRLELSDEVDPIGLPKPKITFGYHDNEKAISRHAAKLMTSIWEAAGASDIWTFERSAHTIGTCRMGHDRDGAVVDSEGRSFDVPNLWICDNSVFPSSLAANPALTIMALSLRTADAMLRDGLR